LADSLANDYCASPRGHAGCGRGLLRVTPGTGDFQCRTMWKNDYTLIYNQKIMALWRI
jgi:hypothetical protein